METKKVSPGITTLDAGNAYWMAKLAKAVYCKKSEEETRPDEEKILHDLKQEDKDFISITGFDKNSAQAMLVEHKDYFCMSFRGTDELADWLDNMDIASTEQACGIFHEGFWESTEDIWGIYSKYKELASGQEQRPLFITGHSLGGAMATVAAVRLLHENIPFVGLYTFGQPRAMVRKMIPIVNAQCKDRFFRFQNNNDIVTRMPALLAGYRHGGTQLYISQHRVIYRKTSFWFSFVDHLSGTFKNLKKLHRLDMISDHDMNEYLAAIQDWNINHQPTLSASDRSGQSVTP